MLRTSTANYAHAENVITMDTDATTSDADSAHAEQLSLPTFWEVEWDLCVCEICVRYA